MKVAFFDTKVFERDHFERANAGHELVYFEPRLTNLTSKLAAGFEVVSCFVNDCLDGDVLRILAAGGTRLIALRCAGYSHVDLVAADDLGIAVVRVPEYSPYAVAEHAVALVLTLNRKIHRAHMRVHEMNFALDGLVGFDLHGKTVGLVGIGRIGRVAAKIFSGFGCYVLGHDIETARGLGVEYVSLRELCSASDVISLHVPLTPATRHMIDARALAGMKRGVMLVNTSRGALVDTRALIRGLKSGHVGAAALDVYEEEEGVFFQDLSDAVLQDDVLARLLTFPNVLITSHQAFLTHEALSAIASTTLASVTAFEQGAPLLNRVPSAK